MKTGDKVKFRYAHEASDEGFDKDTVGVVVWTGDLPAYPKMVKVEFDGVEIKEYWSQSRFVLVSSVD